MQEPELDAEMVEEAEWAPTRERGLWRDAFRALRRNRLAIVAIVVLLILATLAVSTNFTGAIARYSYRDQIYTHVQEGPSSAHFFGTDNLGRDNWSRVLTGVDISLQIGIGTQIIVLVIGMLVGVTAALGGRTSDNILMRITDITYAFPDLLFIILLRAVLVGRDWPVLGEPRLQIMLAIAMVNWVTIARLVRGQMLSLQERDYVMAARTLGASNWRIATQHMLPNTLGPVTVAFAFGIPVAIFAEAALGFVGLGLPPPTPSLGNLVSDGYNFMQVNPWIVAFPAGAIALLMLCFTFLGDGLRDALDPRQR
ncbi:MAG TPA: ABC transporter permease [Dehalococcoidia bacterium]|nr:ABC transporter permease [Dehalococcoidia bacterium]